MQNTSQYFLQNIFQYLWRSRIFAELFNIFAETFSVALQKTSQHVFRTHFSIFAEHISAVLHNTSQYIFEIISQYFCITSPSIFRNFLQQFLSTSQYDCRLIISTFSENLQKTIISKYQKLTKLVKNLAYFQKRIFEL